MLHLVDSDQPKNHTLSDSHLSVLQLIANGSTIDEISLSKGLSSITIGIYISSCVEKLNAKSVANAVNLARRNYYIR